MLAALRNWSWPYFFSSMRAWFVGVLGVTTLIIMVAVAWYGMVQSHGSTYKPVPTSSVPDGTVSGSACGAGDRVVQAWLTYDDGMGTKIYGIRCASGVMTEVAQ